MNSTVGRFCEKGHIILSVDNATSHRINADLSNIKIVFTTPNCTSVLQSTEQGVIWSFKCIFRRMLHSFFVDSIDEMNQKHLISNFDLFEAMHFIECACLEVHHGIIINALRKAEFLIGSRTDPIVSLSATAE